jgi:putative transposase
MDEREDKPMGNVIHTDEARIRDHLGEMVRGTVEGEADKQSHAIARRT